jgi:lipoate-protein ligase A
MSERNWRLLAHGAATGAWNMAVDEALLDSVASGDCPPTLRFYRWFPPCLSLGYFQPLEVVDLSACRALGVDIVRRPTGGRAILHDRELTYSIALPVAVLGEDAGILPSYYRISRALQAGLQALGVETSMAPVAAARASEEHGPICFDRPSAHEILLQGRKLVGSAQVRRAAAILQHGSILIEPRIERLVACLRPAATVADDIEATVIGLSAVGIDRADDLVAAIVRGVEREFGVQVTPASLGPAERMRAHELALSRYGSQDWTEQPTAEAARNTTRTR